MTQDFLEILVDIFKSSGYSVTISGPCEIRVENNGHLAYVMCTMQPDYEEIKAFSEKVQGRTGIYVMARKTTGEFEEYAAGLGIYIWDRDEIALHIGRLVLANLERKAKASAREPEKPENEVMVSPELPAGAYEESEKIEEAVTGTEMDFNIGLVPLAELKSEEKKPSFVPGSAGEAAENRKPVKKLECSEVPKVDSYDVLNIKSVEPRVSKEQAIIIAKPYLSSPKDAVLKFVPFWKYSYSVEAEKRVKSRVLTITGEGKGFLNALNKRKENLELEGLGAPTRIPAVQYEVRRHNFDRQQAEKILLDAIVEENTQEMRFNNTDGQAVIYEQRSIKPKPDEIDLEVELVYIPVWEVKGKRHSLEINAYNAEILEDPVDEDAEFV